MIRAEGVVYDYPTTRALEGVSCEIEAGSITALVGPNGAGKTTFMRCLAALDTPTDGRIVLDGVDVVEDPREAHRRVGFLPDFYGLYDDLTVEQCLRHHAAMRGVPTTEDRDRAHACAERLGITDLLRRPAGALSRGQRQRLAIAQAIIHQPRVVLLDEPASGLDPEARSALSALLRQLQAEGMTLLVSSHILAELEDYSTHMLIIRGGRILEHRPVATAEEGRERRRLRVRLLGDAQAAARLLMQRPEVTQVGTPGEGQVTLAVAGDDAVLAGLLRSLIEAGHQVVGFTEERRTMQDVYLDRVQLEGRA